MRYKAVLFDLDGTLLNTIEDLAESMNQTLVRMGFNPYPVEAYLYFVGDGMENLAKRVLGENNQKDKNLLTKCVNGMEEEYSKLWNKKTRPYPEIVELLEKLKTLGLKMAILSNKPDFFTQKIVSHYFSLNLFEAIAGSKSDLPKKPDPACALEISQKIGIPPGDFLYVGDTNTDMKTANAAGMFAVGALWGFRTAQELLESGARVLIEKPLDLLKLL